MAQKLLKHELIERLLLLQEKQHKLLKQVYVLTQEINELVQPFMPKEPNVTPQMTMGLVAQVLRDCQDWTQCGEIVEKVLLLQGKSDFVVIGDRNYQAVKRILLRLAKQGLVERCRFHWRLKALG